MRLYGGALDFLRQLRRPCNLQAVSVNINDGARSFIWACLDMCRLVPQICLCIGKDFAALEIWEDSQLVNAGCMPTPSPSAAVPKSELARFVEEVLLSLNPAEQSRIKFLVGEAIQGRRLKLASVCSGTDGIVPTLQAPGIGGVNLRKEARQLAFAA